MSHLTVIDGGGNEPNLAIVFQTAKAINILSVSYLRCGREKRIDCSSETIIRSIY